MSMRRYDMQRYRYVYTCNVVGCGATWALVADDEEEAIEIMIGNMWYINGREHYCGDHFDEGSGEVSFKAKER